jgi:hypothetical protein
VLLVCQEARVGTRSLGTRSVGTRSLVAHRRTPPGRGQLPLTAAAVAKGESSVRAASEAQCVVLPLRLSLRNGSYAEEGTDGVEPLSGDIAANAAD